MELMQAQAGIAQTLGLQSLALDKLPAGSLQGAVKTTLAPSLTSHLPWQGQWLGALAQDLSRLAMLNDPRHVYAMCFVCRPL